MNENIKNLRVTALLLVQNELETVGRDHVVMYEEHLDMVNQKFAELIIQRCAHMADCEKNRNPGAFILKQFGIETERTK